MKIQELLFPVIGRCTETELYYRTNSDERADIDRSKPAIVFEKNAKVDFDTYFNGFYLEKWSKYTILNNLSLKLLLSGRFKVILMTKELIHEDVIEKIVNESVIDSQDVQEYVFSYDNADAKKGMYTFALESLQEGSRFYGGSYCSEVPAEKIRKVKIGIGICTFRREAFIEKNLRILKESILENTDSVMYDRLEVFIADNGQTLDREKLSGEKIHINPNRNLGGAGGFTRDLIEILKHNDDLKITHVLLMDDDIVIEPEALVRTYTILSLLKDEYIDAFVGGAMLRLDQQYIQVESGACWNGGQLVSLKNNLDLTLSENCLFNEVEEYREFNAWWFCCFPVNVVREDNLPLPIFIRGDDLEYGLRNMKHLILTNGICVWHEPFENKYSSFLEYYITRNQLIDNSFHCQWFGTKQLAHDILLHTIQELMYYRYRNMDIYLRGIKDFLKGPKWLMEQDGETLHKEIMAAGYKGQELETLDMPFRYSVYQASFDVNCSKARWWFNFLTFNGLLLKAKGENIVSMSACRTVQFYRMKRVMHYDITSNKAFITQKSIGKTFRYLFQVFGLLCLLPFKLKKAQRAYRTEGMKLRTLTFWEQYLGM